MLRTLTLLALVAAACGFNSPLAASRARTSSVRMSTNPSAPIKVGINGARAAPTSARAPPRN